MARIGRLWEAGRTWTAANLHVRLFILVALALLPALATETYNVVEAHKLRAREGEDQALRLARLIAGEQSQVVEGARELLTAIGRTPFLHTGDRTACDAYFADLDSAYPQYVSPVSLGLNGQVRCGSGEADVASGEREYFKLALRSNEFVVGEYVAGQAPGSGSIHFAQPYRSARGDVAGVVAIGFSIDWLNQALARQPLPPGATVSVIDRHGTILARFPEAERFVGQKVAGAGHADLLSGGEGVHESLGFDGIPRIYAFTPVSGSSAGLVVSVGIDRRAVLKGAEAASWRGICVIVLGAVFAFMCIGWGARSFVHRPVQALLTAAERWRRGDLQARVGFRESRSEFGRLGAAFDLMAAAVGNREEELERRVQERTQDVRIAMEAQHQAEVALHQAQKLETVGRLTGGVAHDFNNLLAVIVGNIELASGQLGDAHVVAPRLKAALSSAERGATLISRLLAFARRQHLRPEVVDLNGYILDLKDVLQRLVRSDVTVETCLAPTLWPVRVDPSQLEAAILNLAVNARDAMPQGGRLTLLTANVTRTSELHGDEPAGEFVGVTIADTGTGIPPEHLEKVFEPFFTTKEVGKGSGLGLSMVHGFVRQSAGSVSIDSVVGHGTAVTMYFPRAQVSSVPIHTAPRRALRGEGTVLLVDDDRDVSAVAAQMLDALGYSVLAAREAEEALKLSETADSIRVLVTDLVLPGGMDGLQLARSLRRRHPRLPIVLISGYSPALAEHQGLSGAEFLPKPFRQKALGDTIRRAVQSARLLSVPSALSEIGYR